MSQSCSCDSNYDHYIDQACEYIIPIKLIVPIFLEPKVLVQSTCFGESIQVYLQPEIHLEPEVRSQPPVCIPQVDYHQNTLAASEG